MFQLGELVVYGIHGVCRVKEVQERMVNRVSQQYLVLEPVGKQGSQYMVPMQNEAAMSRVPGLISKEAWEALLASPKVHTVSWIQDENKRKQSYRELTGSGTRETLLQTAYSIYADRSAQKAAGRRLHMCDENFLHDAEKILAGELEAVMGITGPEALTLLRTSLSA